MTQTPVTNQIAPNYPVVIGISGASGSMIANGLIDAVLQSGVPVIATASNAARMVWQQEMDTSFGEALEYWRDLGDFTYYAPGDIQSPIASGSFPTRGMVIAPCSIKTMSNIAMGNTGDLITRAADVILKERRTLVVAIRETPLHLGHIENLARLARSGAVIFPPVPAFYNRPASLQDIVDQSCMRMLDQLDIHIESAPRWGEEGGVPAVGQQISGGRGG